MAHRNNPAEREPGVKPNPGTVARTDTVSVKRSIEVDQAPAVSELPAALMLLPDDVRITVTLRAVKGAWYVESVSAEGDSAGHTDPGPCRFDQFPARAGSRGDR